MNLKKRKCKSCEFETNKRKHKKCPMCGDELTPNITNAEKPVLTGSGSIYHPSSSYPIIDY